MYTTITSLQNPDIKEVAKLSTAKGRKHQQRFIAEGSRTISTLLHYGMEPLHLYAIEHHVKSLNFSFDPKKITVVSDIVMGKISQATAPSGLLCVFAIPKQPPLEQLSSGLVLYDITDPGNAGTLIRTCAAMNQKTVVFINGVDPYNPKVIQSCAGALAQVALYQLSWDELIAHKKQLKLCALVVSGGQSSEKINFTDTLLVVGSEAHGIPAHIQAQCDSAMTLAMPGKTESLNAAVAGCIALYLAWHQAR